MTYVMLDVLMSEKANKTYRVVEFRWLPKAATEWASFTAARIEAGRLWTVMVDLHARVRRLEWKWPSYSRWAMWVKGKFPALSAQSAQQIVKDFCDTLAATTVARKVQKTAGQEVTAKYPWRSKRYRDVPYTNQDAVIRDGVLRLSHGRGGNKALSISLPSDRSLPGRLMELPIALDIMHERCHSTDSALTLHETPAKTKRERLRCVCCFGRLFLYPRLSGNALKGEKLTDIGASTRRLKGRRASSVVDVGTETVHP